MMSKKANMMNHQYRDRILNERAKMFHGQKKVILPRLAAQEGVEHSHPRRSLRRKDQDLQPLPINESSLHESARYRQKGKSRIKTSRTLQSGGDSRQETREIREEKGEVMKEMKGWIKLVETAGKEGTGLQEGALGKLENALYKWCLFVQQTFSCYQKLEHNLTNSTKIPTSTSISKKYKNPEEAPKTPSHESSFKDQRELYEREIRRLSTNLQETEQQIQANRVNNIQSLERVAELERLFNQWSGKSKRDIDREREQIMAVDALLDKNEQFLQELKNTLSKSKDTTESVQRIEEKLKNLNQYKAKRDDNEHRAKGFYL